MQITAGYTLSFKRRPVFAAAMAVLVAVGLVVGTVFSTQTDRSGTLILPENTRPMILIPLPR
jgi:hypothetical protein